MALCQTSVLKLYNTVIEDVISSVRDAFLDEGVDEQVLQEMKQVWTNKLMASKAIEINKDQPDPQPPPLIANSQKSGAIKKKIVTLHQTNNSATASSNNQQSASTANQQQQQQQQKQPVNSSTIPAVQALDPNKIMPVNITLPAQPGTANTESRVLTIQVPASALQENQLTQILTANLISSIMSLPAHLASSVLQQHVNSALQNAKMQSKQQLDGAYDTSDEDNSDISDNDIDNDDDDDIDNEGDEEHEGE
ncbi:GTF2A1 family protein [Megaselia abdita]